MKRTLFLGALGGLAGIVHQGYHLLYHKYDLNVYNDFPTTDFVSIHREFITSFFKDVNHSMSFQDLVNRDYLYEKDQDLSKARIIRRMVFNNDVPEELLEGYTFSVADSLMGFLSMLKTRPMAVATAHIEIERNGKYIEKNKEYLLCVQNFKDDGRNLFPIATLFDTQGNVVRRYTSRFARVKWGSLVLKTNDIKR